uniref:Uncharacterized protein n=1 Tax=Arundo donax TaxID=35708 RepID=A0A0A8ZQA5_ARUDO
MNFHLPLFVFK